MTAVLFDLSQLLDLLHHNVGPQNTNCTYPPWFENGCSPYGVCGDDIVEMELVRRSRPVTGAGTSRASSSKCARPSCIFEGTSGIILY
jgi:hypothetical protein